MFNLTLSAIFVGAFATTAVANPPSWKPLVQCGPQGEQVAFEVDTLTSYFSDCRGCRDTAHTYYQMVLRNSDVISYFESEKAIFSQQINSKGEFIIGAGAFYFNGPNSFYGMDWGITKTANISFDKSSVSFNAYDSHGNLLANFNFNDCR
jgi:hypothetical protein